MDNILYGYEKMRERHGEALRLYSLSELASLAKFLRNNLHGDVADGMVAYVNDVMQIKQAKTELLHKKMFAPSTDCGCLECTLINAQSNVCDDGHTCTGLCWDCSKFNTVPDCLHRDPWFLEETGQTDQA